MIIIGLTKKAKITFDNKDRYDAFLKMELIIPEKKEDSEKMDRKTFV